MTEKYMELKVILPFEIFAKEAKVVRIVVETRGGSLGILPNRLDFTASLSPGILIYEIEDRDEAYIAVDEGVVVKAGGKVIVSVRHAIAGDKLDDLRWSVEKEFLEISEREQNVRSVLAKMESGFIRRLAGFHHD